MSVFDDAVRRGLNKIYDAAGVTATFTDRDANESTVTVLVEYNLGVYGEVADVSGMTAAISARKTDMAFSPRRGETYTVNGTVYTVDSVITETELEHTAITA